MRVNALFMQTMKTAVMSPQKSSQKMIEKTPGNLVEIIHTMAEVGYSSATKVAHCRARPFYCATSVSRPNCATL